MSLFREIEVLCSRVRSSTYREVAEEYLSLYLMIFGFCFFGGVFCSMSGCLKLREAVITVSHLSCPCQKDSNALGLTRDIVKLYW